MNQNSRICRWMAENYNWRYILAEKNISVKESGSLVILKKDVGIAISKSRAMYEELEHDRKAVAGYLKSEPLQTFCFKALGNNLTAAEIIGDMPDLVISRWIEDYSAAKKR